MSTLIVYPLDFSHECNLTFGVMIASDELRSRRRFLNSSEFYHLISFTLNT